jgi:hypothetical protein
MTNVMDSWIGRRGMGEGSARRMWRLYEPIHDVVYFAPEVRAAADRLGLRGFWMGYFALRGAPLGEVDPSVVTASFFGFHPDRVRRALPDAWRYTAALDVLDARSAGVDAALRRLWPDVINSPELAEAAELAWRAAMAADTAGRVLAAANQRLPRPGLPHLVVWQAATTLREHRGDGHVAVLLAYRVTPAQAHLIKAGAGEAEADALREGRQWPMDAWCAAADELRDRGWLDERWRLTAEGWRRHEAIEQDTDAAAEQPWLVLGPEQNARLAELLTPLAAACLSSGIPPSPNAVGLGRDDQVIPR